LEVFFLGTAIVRTLYYKRRPEGAASCEPLHYRKRPSGARGEARI
jgi:hypothetical protein